MKIFDVIIHETIVYRPENRAPREQCIVQHGFEEKFKCEIFCNLFQLCEQPHHRRQRSRFNPNQHC